MKIAQQPKMVFFIQSARLCYDKTFQWYVKGVISFHVELLHY